MGCSYDTNIKTSNIFIFYIISLYLCKKYKVLSLYKVDYFRRTPLQNAFQYTLFLSVLYIVYKLFDINAPSGNDFISYIAVLLVTNVFIVVFPILFIFFYFKDGTALNEVKETFSKKDNTQLNELNNQDMLREYHGMLKEGVITQDEYDNIKKKYLKDLHKDA